jgi:hypothetical protein
MGDRWERVAEGTPKLCYAAYDTGAKTGRQARVIIGESV